MPYCENCGGEVREGAKFCPNCGAAGKASGNMQPNYKGNSGQSTGLDRYGKFIGIGLLAVAIIDFFSDPAFVTILLSMAIIAGAIFCFSKRYKLKVFTIFALILSMICLFTGIYQASKFGLFKLPKDEEYEEQIAKDLEPVMITPKVESKPKTNNDIVIPGQKTDQETKKDEMKPTEEVCPEEPAGSTGGVDPDLKAFLDSYEAFVDEYVIFMKKYMNDPTNALSMIGEYGEIMQKYEDFAKKVEQYDTNEMSVEDAKYYLEVTGRCTQKMMDIL